MRESIANPCHTPMVVAAAAAVAAAAVEGVVVVVGRAWEARARARAGV